MVFILNKGIRLFCIKNFVKIFQHNHKTSPSINLMPPEGGLICPFGVKFENLKALAEECEWLVEDPSLKDAETRSLQ